MKPINTIATQWELFKAQCIKFDGTETRAELEQWRAFFYGGAAALVHTIDAVDAAERDKQVNAIREELGDYAREVRSKYPGGELPRSRRR